MAATITSVTYSAGTALNSQSPADKLREEISRVVVSRSSFTRFDGSVVTTISYSDGTTETQTTSSGDTVELSPAAQSLLAA